jgi:NADP-dependent 3-hydroxy acid dehydrogenase YdfG
MAHATALGDESEVEVIERGVGTVVITGASAGVGRATAIAFARNGFNVGLIAPAAIRLGAQPHASTAPAGAPDLPA